MSSLVPLRVVAGNFADDFRKLVHRASQSARLDAVIPPDEVQHGATAMPQPRALLKPECVEALCQVEEANPVRIAVQVDDDALGHEISSLVQRADGDDRLLRVEIAGEEDDAVQLDV